MHFLARDRPGGPFLFGRSVLRCFFVRAPNRMGVMLRSSHRPQDPPRGPCVIMCVCVCVCIMCAVTACDCMCVLCAVCLHFFDQVNVSTLVDIAFTAGPAANFRLPWPNTPVTMPPGPFSLDTCHLVPTTSFPRVPIDSTTACPRTS